MDAFSDFLNDDLFPRIRDDDVDMQSDNMYEIITDEIDSFISCLSPLACERLLFDFGFGEALTVYRNCYGLETLGNGAGVDLIVSLLGCAMCQTIIGCPDLSKRYNDWLANQ